MAYEIKLLDLIDIELDASFLVLFNAHHDLIEFTLPDPGEGRWHVEIDTSFDTGIASLDQSTAPGNYPLQARSLVILRQPASHTP